jgi:glucose 1-dehydrogenase
MRLTGKVAIVTGAGTGIGQAIALAFAGEGAKVVVDYVGAASSADETVGKIRALKVGDAIGECIAVEADVSNPDAVNGLMQATLAAYGRLDILVNNAGIEKKVAFVDFPLEAWNKILAVNLTGPFLCAQAAAKQMILQNQGEVKGGRIINISSIHEDMTMPTNAPYCATKGGLRMLMRTIAVELAQHKITVNNIGPGATYTPIDADVIADAKLNAEILAGIPMGRWGTPEEVAKVAVFLASEDAGYVTGSTYFVDGGMMRMAGSL